MVNKRVAIIKQVDQEGFSVSGLKLLSETRFDVLKERLNDSVPMI